MHVLIRLVIKGEVLKNIRNNSIRGASKILSTRLMDWEIDLGIPNTFCLMRF
jgi:hypothetical protein